MCLCTRWGLDDQSQIRCQRKSNSTASWNCFLIPVLFCPCPVIIRQNMVWSNDCRWPVDGSIYQMLGKVQTRWSACWDRVANLSGLIKPALMRYETPRSPRRTMAFCYQRVCVACMMESGLDPSVPEWSPRPHSATHVCDSHLGDHLGKWAPISSGYT